MAETITIDRRYQGVTGRGQGGYAAGLLAQRISGPARVDFFNPIPLNHPLEVRSSGERWELLNGDTLILRVRPHNGDLWAPAVATLEEAEAAMADSPVYRHRVVPDCYSCGTVATSMGVHPGPLPGRDEFATIWTPPPWAADSQGLVLAQHVWAATDCPGGWKAGTTEKGGFRLAVTGQMSMSLIGPVVEGRTYAIVAWSGEWKGRRVKAATALFDEYGTCLASTASTWIALH